MPKLDDFSFDCTKYFTKIYCKGKEVFTKYSDGAKFHFNMNSKFHNIRGPAIEDNTCSIEDHSYCAFYINGKLYTKEKWLSALEKLS